MKEKRLYFDNSYIKNFSAKITDIYSDKDKVCIILDNTGFYPASGGQPCDNGFINSYPLIDVLEREDGQILHVLSNEGKSLNAGETVSGIIDWDRRFDHMQQHTGQHILSQAFLKLFSFETVGFHLGKEISTIDLKTSSLLDGYVNKAEELANSIIFENRSICVNYYNQEEIKNTGIRKEIEHHDILRVVNIGDFDLSLCCGTHCSSSGEVGLLLIKDVEKIKDKTRIHFVCGMRALKTFREFKAIYKELSSRFSTGLSDIISKFDKLMSENKENNKLLKKLKERYLDHEIELLYSSKKPINEINYIFGVYDDRSLDDLKAIAKRMISGFKSVVLFISGASEPVSLIIARTSDVSLNLSEILRNKSYNGKGGGSSDFVQGGGYSLKDIKNISIELENILLSYN